MIHGSWCLCLKQQPSEYILESVQSSLLLRLVAIQISNRQLISFCFPPF